MKSVNVNEKIELLFSWIKQLEEMSAVMGTFKGDFRDEQGSIDNIQADLKTSIGVELYEMMKKVK